MSSTQSLVRLLILVGVGLGGVALAGDGGVDDLDASLPDASVGQGGADRDNPEGEDGQPIVFCRLNRDCDKGFNCVNGKCSWVGYRNATNGGCSGAPGLIGLGLGSLALRLKRSRSRRR